MQDVRRQRLSMIQHRDRNTYEAIAWLSKNKEMFREPILEPVMMSVNIKDPRYVNQVENFLGGKDFHSFVAQNEEDKEKFLKEVHAVYIILRCCVFIHVCDGIKMGFSTNLLLLLLVIHM